MSINLIFLVFMFMLIRFNSAKLVDLTSDNFYESIKNTELVFVNFLAEWCRFSQQLKPIFERSAQLIDEHYQNENKVMFARLDCDQHRDISSRYKINKYPTLKFFLNGKMLKKEYRGQRTEVAIINHVKQLLSNPIVHLSYNNVTDFDSFMHEKAAIIKYTDIPAINTHDYDIFRKVAIEMKGYCDFYWINDAPREKPQSIVFTDTYSEEEKEYPSNELQYEELSSWTTSNCIPLVREITFENAEEIIEEGMPLVILFHRKDDKVIKHWFKHEVYDNLLEQTSKVNFVTGDGEAFLHPLQHLGKTKDDLPLITIDSFKHMFVLPTIEEIQKGNVLSRFINDLHSGKLHREMHFGPDPIETSRQEEKVDSIEDNEISNDKIEDKDSETKGNEKNEARNEVLENTYGRDEKEDYEEYHEAHTQKVIEVTQQDSVFKKLAPSEFRYSFVRDEL